MQIKTIHRVAPCADTITKNLNPDSAVRRRSQARNACARGIFLIVLAALTLSGCDKIKEFKEKLTSKDSGAPGGAAAAQVSVFAVNTIAASRGQIQDYIALSGDIVAGSTVDAYSDAAGKIVEVYVSVGQWVTKGQRIAAVDPSRPGMTYQWSYAVSPISGTVVTLPAQVGMTITQAVPLARISGGGALEIKLHIAERFISKMAMNLPCQITLDAWPGDVFQGSIREIAPTVDPTSRTMEVMVNVSNPGSKLKQGMFAKVRIITERKNNIVKIPESALLSRFGEQYVYVVEQNPENREQSIVRKRDVVPGIHIDGVLEIQNGLEPDEEVVVRGQTLLEDGARVNVIDRLQPLSAN
jgi:multidrug efflux pump subunit AcrA (membrane-fusion protein)